MIREYNIHNYFFPIFGGVGIERDFIPLNVYGTATCIGSKLFLTAGHTIKNAATNESFHIGFANLRTKCILYSIINDYEIFDSVDLAIISLFHGSKYAKTFKIRNIKVNYRYASRRKNNF